VLAAALSASAGPGCVREVISGEDPQARRNRITGKADRDSLVVNIPWMEAPIPRLGFDGRMVVFEIVDAPVDQRTQRFTLRTPDDKVATVRARRVVQRDGSIEFAYTVDRLPSGYSLDVPFDLDPEGLKPAIDLAVNGAPVQVPPANDFVAVQLARDATTRIVARPRPVPSAPAASPPSSPPRTNP
jgi:hypothetical protein